MSILSMLSCQASKILSLVFHARYVTNCFTAWPLALFDIQLEHKQVITFQTRLGLSVANPLRVSLLKLNLLELTMTTTRNQKSWQDHQVSQVFAIFSQSEHRLLKCGFPFADVNSFKPNILHLITGTCWNNSETEVLSKRYLYVTGMTLSGM